MYSFNPGPGGKKLPHILLHARWTDSKGAGGAELGEGGGIHFPQQSTALISLYSLSHGVRLTQSSGPPLQGGCISCEGRNDASDYGSIRSAMHLFFSEPERLDILKLLAAVLHLGNISFEGDQRRC